MSDMKDLEKRIEDNEKITANLVASFIQLSSAVEQIMDEFLQTKSQEQVETFRKELSKRHTSNLQTIQEMSRAAGAASNPEEAIEAIRSVVGERKGK